jgi:hypothetical protein
VCVAPNPLNHTPTEAPPVDAQAAPLDAYVAVLDESRVEEISAAAGARKDLSTFARMLHAALLGATPTLSFYVENCVEMKARIARRPLTGAAPTARAEAPRDADEMVDDAVRQEFFVRQRFLTLDYDVEFTRAVYAIPLEEVGSIGSSANAASKCGGTTLSIVGSPGAPFERGVGPQSSEEVDRLVGALRETIDIQQRDLERLQRENAALTILAKEKMSQMKKFCEDVNRRVGDPEMLRRMREQNQQYQREVLLLEKENHSLRREVERLRRTGGGRGGAARSPSPTIRPQLDTSGRGSEVLSSAGRRTPRSRSPNPSGRVSPARSSPLRQGHTTATAQRSGAPDVPRQRFATPPGVNRFDSPAGAHTHLKERPLALFPRSPQRHFDGPTPKLPPTTQRPVYREGAWTAARTISKEDAPAVHRRLYAQDTLSSSNARRSWDDERGLY